MWKIPDARAQCRSTVASMATTRNRNLPLRVRVVASFILGCVVSGLALSPVVGAPMAQAACLAPVRDCTSGAVSGGGVALVRTKVTPGSSGTPAKKVSSGSSIVVPLPKLAPEVLNLQCAVITPRPWYCPPKVVVRITPAVPATPTVVLADIANFIPQAPALRSEPAGWGIIGLPINFIATEPTHDVPGRLLGMSATVRFSPTSFAWSYGDGQSRTTAMAGSTWAALALPTFSATPTSHTYAKSGLFTVVVTATLTASYRLGSGSWQSISGTLTRSASITVRLASGAVPVLVSESCRAGQAGLGC